MSIQLIHILKNYASLFPHLSGQISFHLVNELNFEWNGEKIGGLILGWVQPRLRNKMHVNFPFLNPMLRDELVGLAKTPGKFITYSLILPEIMTAFGFLFSTDISDFNRGKRQFGLF